MNYVKSGMHHHPLGDPGVVSHACVVADFCEEKSEWMQLFNGHFSKHIVDRCI